MSSVSILLMGIFQNSSLGDFAMGKGERVRPVSRPIATVRTYLLVALLLSLAITHPAKATVISVDFQANPKAGGDYAPSCADPKDNSGVDPYAQAANSAFGVANVWNHLEKGATTDGLIDGATFSAIEDSTGAATSVGLVITGKFGMWNSTVGLDNLRGDYLELNQQDWGTDASISWSLTGLGSNTSYVMFLYSNEYNVGLPENNYSSFNMTVDANGNGVLDESSTLITGKGVLVTAISSSSGVILGMASQEQGHSAGWAGFQVASIPEPSTLILAAISLLGLLAYAWWKRR